MWVLTVLTERNSSLPISAGREVGRQEAQHGELAVVQRLVELARRGGGSSPPRRSSSVRRGRRAPCGAPGGARAASRAPGTVKNQARPCGSARASARSMLRSAASGSPRRVRASASSSSASIDGWDGRRSCRPPARAPAAATAPAASPSASRTCAAGCTTASSSSSRRRARRGRARGRRARSCARSRHWRATAARKCGARSCVGEALALGERRRPRRRTARARTRASPAQWRRPTLAAGSGARPGSGRRARSHSSASVEPPAVEQHRAEVDVGHADDRQRRPAEPLGHGDRLAQPLLGERRGGGSGSPTVPSVARQPTSR